MNDPHAPRTSRSKRRKKRSNTKPRPEQSSNAWMEFVRQISNTIAERSKQRSVLWLAIVLLLTTSAAIDAIFRSGFVPGLFNGLTYLNFIFHELGHLACRFTPQWFHVAAGTVAQLLLPLGAIRMFVRQQDDAACCFAMSWLAVSLMHTADYMSDARAMNGDMTLSAGFWSLTSGQAVRPNELIHDWNFMLQACGLLQWDTTLAIGVRILASAIAIFAVVANLFMFWTAAKNRLGQPS